MCLVSPFISLSLFGAVCVFRYQKYYCYSQSYNLIYATPKISAPTIPNYTEHCAVPTHCTLQLLLTCS